jgi:hypothetical protein
MSGNQWGSWPEREPGGGLPDRCEIPGCPSQGRGNPPLCRRHRRMLPLDLRERMRWAQDDGDEIEIEAAIRAITEYIRGET